MKIFAYIALLLIIIIGGGYLYNKIEADHLELNDRLSRLERIEEYRMMKALKDLLSSPSNGMLPKPEEDRGT